mmetsp:Transcript_41299/g.95966  ORF Transcript_41299/g.95966 Transcript_41299/m.95966 type:complete len:508 (-) Transcript_41299:16-1539(-)
MPVDSKGLAGKATSSPHPWFFFISLAWLCQVRGVQEHTESILQPGLIRPDLRPDALMGDAAAVKLGKQAIMRREVAANTILDNLTQWQQCSNLALSECCSLGRVRVNNGQGNCRCGPLEDDGPGPAKICALQWQPCSTLRKETCCGAQPAAVLVAFGNSSASGFASHCACADTHFTGLTEAQVSRRCGLRDQASLCLGSNLTFAPVDHIGARVGHTHFRTDGARRLSAKRTCGHSTSLRFTTHLHSGREYVLRMEARQSQPTRNRSSSLRLLISNKSIALPVDTAGTDWRWIEEQFRAPRDRLQMQIRTARGSCVDLGRIELASCEDLAKSSPTASALALRTETASRGQEAPEDEGVDAAQKQKDDDEEKEIAQLKEQVEKDKEEIDELEYKAATAQNQKEAAEAAAAEPSGGSVPTWLAVATVGLVLISSPILARMKGGAGSEPQEGSAKGPRAKAAAGPAAKAKGQAKAKAGGKGKGKGKGKGMMGGMGGMMGKGRGRGARVLKG